jgi:hypothetical protein
MAVITNRRFQYLHEYGNWADFLDAVRDSKSEWRERCSRTGDKSFTGTQSYEETMRLAELGWKKGRDKVRSGLAVAAKKITSSAYQNLNLEMGGNYPCVPAFLAGSPEAMVDCGNQSISAKPILRIVVDCMAPFYVNQEHLFNHGIAALSAVAELEKQGYSVEVSVIGASRNYDGGRLVGFRAVFKKAGGRLDMDRAAFAMASPSVLRRLFFDIVEQHADCESGMAGSYGTCRQAREYAADMYKSALILPPPDSRDCASIEGALKRVTDGLKGLGVVVHWDINSKARS